MYRSTGKLEQALATARRVEEGHPDDVTAAVDVAELCLELGELDEAATAFGRLLELDDEPEHDVYAYHGMIEVEIFSQQWWQRERDQQVRRRRFMHVPLCTGVARPR